MALCAKRQPMIFIEEIMRFVVNWEHIYNHACVDGVVNPWRMVNITAIYMLAVKYRFNKSVWELIHKAKLVIKRNFHDEGRFLFRKKPRKFRWEQKRNFRLVKVVPFGRKPQYVAVPDRGPGTGTNYERRKWNTTFDMVRKFQPGKRAHLFKFSSFSGNFPVGRTDETCSIYRRTKNSGNFD